ncbi:hypothetical protein [Pseudomonas lini]|uniref:Uncharacterized protein n=1 Tax=Pseudomonas lini TaxID=163011 RepID=A0A7V7P2L1_9PSED|nr:hypothetical protein [Pseudomonas lini]KAB0502795.1 hypothetical protein F7R14_19370 [Pseudomonas lini]
MSEDEIQNTRQFAVSAHDFVRFLEAKTLDSPCPACSFQGWTVIGSSKNGSTYRLATPLRDGPKPSQVSTFAIYCNECGFVRHHLSRKVREWIDENPEPEQLDLEEVSEADFE